MYKFYVTYMYMLTTGKFPGYICIQYIRNSHLLGINYFHMVARNTFIMRITLNESHASYKGEVNERIHNTSCSKSPSPAACIRIKAGI